MAHRFSHLLGLLWRADPALLDRLEQFERRRGCLLMVAVLTSLFMIGLRVGFDFAIYWAAATDVAKGGSAYDHTLALGAAHIGAVQIYVYPPVLAHLLAPLTQLVPLAVGWLLWTTASLVIVGFAWRSIPAHAGRRWPRLTIASGAALTSLWLGQVNLIVAAGMALALGATSVPARAAGALLAGWLRTTPGAVGLFLLTEGRWRAVATASAALALMVLLSGGLSEWRTWLAVTADVARAPVLDTWWQTSPLHFSLYLSALAFVALLITFVFAGRREPVEARDLRATALGLALVLLPSAAWTHWYVFALVPALLAATRHAWARRLWFGGLLAQLTIAPLGAPLIVGVAMLGAVGMARRTLEPPDPAMRLLDRIS